MEADENESDEEENATGNGRIRFDMQPKFEEMSVMDEPFRSNASSVQDTISMVGIEDVIDEGEVQKFREEVENMQWPDQVDFPVDTLARERFQRYRALKSFRFVILTKKVTKYFFYRTSPWDPKENLPVDYARIFKFANFKRTKQLALENVNADYNEENAGEVAMPGSYVTIYIENVPSHILGKKRNTFLKYFFIDDWANDKPFIMHGLMKNEQKFSLMNVILRKYPQCNIPIKNKQTLIFHVGFRRFEIDPIFSQHSNGNKFKVKIIKFT